jgi:hypothetical protein
VFYKNKKFIEQFDTHLLSSLIHIPCAKEFGVCNSSSRSLSLTADGFEILNLNVRQSLNVVASD